MAIEHTRTVQRVEAYPDGRIMVVYIDRFDDPDDDLLPTESNKVVHLNAHADVTAHLQFVQDVCAGAWTNVEQAVITPMQEDVAPSDAGA